MYSKSRNSKGSIVVEAFQGRLRLRLSRELGLRSRYLTLGMNDTPENRKRAEAKAKQIESDIRYERFDASLNKYRNQPKLTVTESIKPKAAYDLAELWEKYTQMKKGTVKASTWKNGFTVMTAHLSRCPHKKLDESQKIFDWAIANLSPDTAKRFVVQMNACCTWARRSTMIDSNPFKGMASEIKVPKSSSEENDINPFSREERDLIIQAFKQNRYYRHYAGLVEFLFLTGCRPSEAIALQWKHVSNDFRFITFEQAVTASLDGLTLSTGLKTQDKRKFNCNFQLQSMLQSIKPEEAKPDDSVFPSPEGKWIDFHNFRNRAWVRILESLSIEYRKPYQTRHTFITMCVEADVPVPQIAKWVSNSAKVVTENYLGVINRVQVPEL